MAVNINVPSQVKTYANLAAFPATGELKTIYIAEDNNKTYRWTGSVYVEISASAAAAVWGNITGTLSNQTDLQNALNAKENTITAGTTSQYFRGDKTFQTLDKAAVGLGNVDNTSDASKPISTATQTALNAKQNTLTLTTTGTSGAATLVGSTLNIPQYSGGASGITIGTTAITSGTVGRILFEGTGNVVQESGNLFWDNTNGRLGIGTSTPTARLNVLGGGSNYALHILNTATGAVGGTETFLAENTNASGQAAFIFKADRIAYNSYGGMLYGGSTASTVGLFGAGNRQDKLFLFADGVNNLGMYVGTLISQPFVIGTNNLERMRIFGGGNVGINTTTDAGFRLDVNGTARVIAPNGFSMVYDSNGVFNLNGLYSRFDLLNASGSLRARIFNEGPHGTLTLYHNATSYIFLNGAASGNNSYIATALSIGNQSAANASSILELTSTIKGFLPPRMTTTQKNVIATPATGLQVYDTTLNRPCFYDGTTWITL